MVDASFSSPGGESSMKEGDEENVLPNSNQKQLPSHSSPKDQTNSEREEDTALVLLELDVNNVNRKTNEGAKHCDGNSQKNGKRLRGSGDSPPKRYDQSQTTTGSRNRKDWARRRNPEEFETPAEPIATTELINFNHTPVLLFTVTVVCSLLKKHEICTFHASKSGIYDIYISSNAQYF